MSRPFPRSIALFPSAHGLLAPLYGLAQRRNAGRAARGLGLRAGETRRRLGVSLFLCVALNAPANSAFADDRDHLTPGLYVAATVGCDGLGGGGTVDFDGKNFSPHYQACLTQTLAQNARYRQTCIEGQGPSYPTTAQIQSDPTKTTRDVTIAILSEKSFTMNGTRYNYCGAR
jgi:hypothetical protein